LAARIDGQFCLTDAKHHDPCASIRIKNVLFEIAWDENTRAISYLFTSDHHFVTESELGVGGLCNIAPKIGEPVILSAFLDWMITRKWADASPDLSGDAVWYAALQKYSPKPRYARIVGFVQSRYLKAEP
jgi:hypothetical protein